MRNDPTVALLVKGILALILIVAALVVLFRLIDHL